MEYMPALFSLLFFVAFAAYLFLGTHIFQLNPGDALNKCFFAVCLCMSLWSLGFSIANSAPDMETCLYWRRISALGWASVYSVFLHLFLLLNGDDRRPGKTRLYYLLYIPAVVFVYAFSISNGITAEQFNFVRVDYGWINKAVQNSWTKAFNLYYIGYVLACLSVLKTWHWSAKDKETHRQSNIIFYSLLTSLLMGTLTDVVISSRLTTPLPQMAPVFIVIPIFSMYFFMKRNRIVVEQKENRHELILSHESQTKYFNYLGTMMLSGAVLGLLSLFLPGLLGIETNIKFTLHVSWLMLLLGISIILMQLIKSNLAKNALMLAMALVTIPIATLHLMHYAGITVWVLALVLMMSTLVFNSRIPLCSIAAVAIVTQIILFIYGPKEPIIFDKFDYIFRIGIIIITLWVGTIINNTYRKRLEENFYQIEFQKIVSDVSSSFVGIDQSTFNEKIHFMLEKAGTFFNVDKAGVYLLEERKEAINYTHEWCSKKIKSEIKDATVIPADKLNWLVKKLQNEKLVIIGDTKETPDLNAKSLILIPIEDDRDLVGFIGLGTVLSCRNWSSYHVSLLKILANLLSDGLFKIKSEKEREHMAYYDHLTGLPNRTLFEDRLNQAIELAKRNATLVGVIFVDIDSFKTINDTMGHSGGDAVIKVVAQKLKENTRSSDTVARFGGDEFLILINDVKKSEDVVTAVDNVMELFKSPFSLDDHDFYLTCSAGIAVYPYDGENTEELIKNSDTAMYSAKAGGKNQYVLCTHEMREEVQKNMVLTNDLYRALEKDELMLYYQPQIGLETGRITGLEALLRWRHSKLGMVLPGVFVPLAEKSGLINSIGEWVIRTAAFQNKKWQEMGLAPLRVAVNLSAIQFNNPHIVRNIAEILGESRLDPKFLELEITESITIKETADTVNTFNELKNLGITISIDDFGTEYSSLGRLKQLPIDRIKIDMQFIRALESSEKDQAITKVIINLAKSLKLQVLAEGVETETQLDFLNQKMCDEVQGFYFYEPMPPEEIEKLLVECAKTPSLSDNRKTAS